MRSGVSQIVAGPCRAAAAALALAVLAAIAAGAEPAAPAAAAKPLHYRRIYAPADRVGEWPRGTTRYLPIEREEFERLLAAANAAAPESRPVASARIVTAEYCARLSGASLVGGTAKLKIEVAGKAPAALPIDPCNLAIQESKQNSADAAPGIVGLSAEGKLAILAARSEDCDLEWSLGGRADAGEGAVFDIRLPPCTVNTFLLDAPEGLVLSADRGMVHPLGYVDEGIERWRIDLGGNNVFQLKAVPAGKPALRSRSIKAIQSTLYDVSLKGIELSCQLQIDAYNERLRSFVLRVDGGLQVTRVACGDLQLPFTVRKSPEGETELVAAFPESFAESRAVVQVKGLSPIELDARCTLPSVRLRDVFWQEGDAEVVLRPPLRAEAISAAGGRQTTGEPISGTETGESYRFQLFSPDATIEGTFAAQEPALAVTSAAAVEFGPAAATARVAVELRSTAGQHFAAEADIADDWLIDSINSQPAEAIEDWAVERAGGKSRLTIRFATPVSPQRAVRLIAVAKRPGNPSGNQYSTAELIPLTFSAATSRQFLALRALPPYGLQLSGGEGFSPLDPAGLSASQRDLLPETSRDVLLEVSPKTESLRIRAAAQQPAFSAKVQVEALVADEAIEERYVFRCQPESGAVDRLRVVFTTPRQTPPRWTLSGRPQSELASRRLRNARVEVWEVTIPEAAAGEPFEVSAERRTPLSGPAALSLASLPDAGSQRATVIVRSRAASRPVVVNSRLQAIPSATVDDAGKSRLLGTYRYDPATEAAMAQARNKDGGAAALLILPGSAMPDAFVWSLDVASWFGYDGAAAHTATFRVQNSGRGMMRIGLPADCRAESCEVQVDGRTESVRFEDAQAKPSLQVALDADRRFSTVTLRLSTPFRGLGSFGSLAPPSLDSDLPVLSEYWTAWVPPGYAWHGGNRRYLAVDPPAEAVGRRLFGPLGRGKDDAICNPFIPATWAPAITKAVTRQSSLQAGEAWLQAIGELLVADPHDARWGDVLGCAPGDGRVVLIDAAAMARLSIAPQAAVGAAKTGGPASRAAGAIQAAGLALIVHPRAVLVTGQEEAALWRAWLEDSARPQLWSCEAGPLAGQIEQAAAGGDGLFLVADTWRRQPGDAAAVWQPSLAGGDDAVRGWAAARTFVPDDEPVCLRYENLLVTRLAGLVAFLVAYAVGWRTARRSARLHGAAACVAAAAALAVSDPILPTATGALLGLILPLGWTLLRKPAAPQMPAAEEQRPAEGPSPGSVSAIASTATRAFLLCVMAMVASSAWGGEKQTPDDYQVFVPVDANEQPTGDKLQISEDFFRELYRRAQASAEAPHGWILGNALYRGELVKDEGTGRYRIDRITGVFDLFVISPKTRVRIPIHREGANLAAEGASLNGEKIQVDWEPEGNALAFDVESPGYFRLELALRGIGLADGFEASIPRLASSSLELTVPATAPNIEAVSALGTVSWKNSPRRFVASLGPTDRLSLRWGNGGGPIAAAAAVDVEQLQWMHILPGSVTMDVKWKIKVVEGRLRQMHIAADPRLRLVPSAGTNGPSLAVRSIGPQSQSLLVSWKSPVRDEAVVEARFLLPGTPSAGVIRPPQIDAIDGRTTRRMLAVSVDKALEFEQKSADAVEPVPPSDFIAAWGKATAPPLLAMRLTSGDALWHLTARPREARTTVEQTLAVAYAEDHAQVAYDAQLATIEGTHLQVVLAVPRQLQIERVSFLVDGADRVDHWSRNDGGEVHVFLKEAVSGRETVSLRGWLPAAIGAAQALPDIRMKGFQLHSSTLQIYRQSGVLANVSPGRGLSAAAPPPPAAQPAEFGRLVRALRADPAVEPEGNVLLTLNRPKVHVEQIVWLRRAADTWTAQCDSRVDVEGGDLDELRTTAPANLLGPLRPSAGASARLMSAAGDSQTLVVRPETAVRGRAFFSVAGALGPSAGDRFTAPQFVPQCCDASRRLLALPKLLNGRPVAWDMIGMRPADLPADFPRPADAAAFDLYEVFEEPCKAVLNVSEQSLGSARVRLCDVTTAWQSDGGVRGAVSFDVDPGKAAACPLHVPAGLRIVSCSVAGIAANLLPDPGGALQIPLAVARLPQRIEVVFEGRPAPGGSAAIALEAPSLGDLPVEQTLWTVLGPASVAWSVGDSSESVTPWQVAMTRLKAAAAVAQSAAAQSNIAAEDLTNWYRAHAARLAAAQRAAVGALGDAPRSQPVRIARLELRAIEQEQSQLAERLGERDTLDLAVADAPAADTAAAILTQTFDPAALRCALAAQGRIDRVLLRTAVVADEAVRYRTALSVAIAALACMLAFGSQRLLAGPVRIARGRPWAVGMLLGAAWWLALRPSAAGLLIAAACAFGWLRSALPRRNANTPAGPAEPPADPALAPDPPKP